jgi:GNAT superfamily N-acetyltransferase
LPRLTVPRLSGVGEPDDFDPFLAYATTYAAFAEATPGFSIAPVGRPGSLKCGVSQFRGANFNRVMAVRLTEDEVEHAIDSVMAVHDAAGVPGSWWLDPGSTPVGIDQALERCGYRAEDTAPVMSMQLSDLRSVELPAGVELSFAHGQEAMREAQLLVGIGFSRPMDLVEEMADVIAPLGDVPDSPARVVVARIDGVPVASATGVTTADLCGVFNVVTLPEARGKGLGAATTLAVLRDATERGARMGVLHASKMGFGVYVRMGFRHGGDFRLFVRE